MIGKVLPQVKHWREAGRTVCLPKTWAVYAPDETSRRVLNALRLLWPSLKLEEAAEADATLRLCYTPGEETDERYTVTVGDRVTLGFSSFRGGRNAAATFCQLLTPRGDGWELPVCEIEDWPDYGWRGMMLDVARGYIPIPRLRDRILQMAMCKLNILHLHLLDAEGYALSSKAYPRLRPAEGAQVYTNEEMRDIVAYAAALGIDCVPELDVPGHGRMLTETYPERTQCQTQTVDPSPWTVCIGNEGLYDLIGALIREVADIFPYPILHLGTDEFQMYDHGDEIPTWHDCALCGPLSEREGMDGDTERFYHFVRRVHALVTAAGRRMMMFNDDIDIAKSPDIPRDILIHFWRVAAPTRGPREGCSMQRFLDEGFEVVNSFYEETYIDLYATENTFAVWKPDKSPAVTAHGERLIGAETCAWELHPHYEWTIPSHVALFADRVWNPAPVTYEAAYKTALTRLLCGASETPFDVFSPLGGISLPYDDKTGKRGYPERAEGDPRAAREALSRCLPQNTATARTAAVYADCLDWIENAGK